MIRVLVFINFIASVANAASAIYLLSHGNNGGYVSFVVALMCGYLAALFSLKRERDERCIHT